MNGAGNLKVYRLRPNEAVLAHEWMERDRLGFRRHCCTAERVTIAVLLEMEMLEDGI